MPTYKYKESDAKGHVTEGIQVAVSREQLIEHIRSRNRIPVSVEEYDTSKDLNMSFSLSKVKIRDISVFCRQFYTMFNAGMPITNCLDILRQQSENKKLRQVLNDVYEDVQKGHSFSEALRSHTNVFPEILINMLDAGEISGNLDTIMERMAVHFEKENRINTKLKGAMIYPMVLSFVALGVVIFMIVFVIPTFVTMFASATLPLPTRVLMGMSNFITENWLALIIVLGIAIFGFSYFAKTSAGRVLVDDMKLKAPIIGMVNKKIITSRFTRTLSTLMKSGIPLIQALEIVAKVLGNKVAENNIMEVREEVRKGMDLATPIKKTGLFPPMIGSVVKIGEESGALDDILDKTANFYDEEVETALQSMVALIEPLMILVMAGLIGGIVISILLPMFDMLNLIT